MHFTAHALLKGTQESVDVVATDLSEEQVGELKEWLGRRWHLGKAGRGTVASLQIRSSSNKDVQQQLDCYCCHLGSTTGTSGAEDEADGPGLVICLLSSLIGCLDLYHLELDAFAQRITKQCAGKPEAGREAAALLGEWFPCCVLYISRAVKALQGCLSQTIFVAMNDWTVEITSEDPSLSRDIQSFCRSCSLSELHDSGVTQGGDATTCQLQLKTDASPQCSCQETSRFARKFASALEIGSADDPVALKHIVQDYKMKAIQDLNTLKRLVHRAESDNYSLYCALEFVRTCGNGAVLLHHCLLDTTSWENPRHMTSQGVLKALQQHVAGTGGFVPLRRTLHTAATT